MITLYYSSMFRIIAPSINPEKMLPIFPNNDIISKKGA